VNETLWNSWVIICESYILFISISLKKWARVASEHIQRFNKSKMFEVYLPLLDPRRAWGRLDAPLRFFEDSIKMAARRAAIFGTAVGQSITNTLCNF